MKQRYHGYVAIKYCIWLQAWLLSIAFGNATCLSIALSTAMEHFYVAINYRFCPEALLSSIAFGTAICLSIVLSTVMNHCFQAWLRCHKVMHLALSIAPEHSIRHCYMSGLHRALL